MLEHAINPLLIYILRCALTNCSWVSVEWPVSFPCRLLLRRLVRSLSIVEFRSILNCATIDLIVYKITMYAPSPTSVHPGEKQFHHSSYATLNLFRDQSSPMTLGCSPHPRHCPQPESHEITGRLRLALSHSFQRRGYPTLSLLASISPPEHTISSSHASSQP